MASLPYPRSHQTIFPQNSRNTQKRLAEKKNLCTSVKSVGGSYLPEGSVGSTCSVGDSYLKLCWCSGDRCTPKDCHATTTRLPRYNNKIATLRQQDCHATATRLPRYSKMSRDGCKMNWKIGWKIGWKITPIVQVSSSHYFTDTQHVVRRLEDIVDIFTYSILFIAS